MLLRSTLKRLSADGAIVKPEVFPGPDEKQVQVQSTEQVCKHGVTEAQISEAMRAAGAGKNLDVLKTLHIRSANGDAISLVMLASLSVASGPAGLYRIDMYPAVRITGSPPEGKTESAAARCEARRCRAGEPERTRRLRSIELDRG